MSITVTDSYDLTNQVCRKKGEKVGENPQSGASYATSKPMTWLQHQNDDSSEWPEVVHSFEW